MKVLIVDDHAIFRAGLRSLLEIRGDVEVSESASGRDAVTQARRVRPDVVVMDVSMPDTGGIEATRQIVSALPTTRIIGLSAHSDARFAAAMFAAGAAGYVLKQAAYDELRVALDTVTASRRYVSRDLTLSLAHPQADAPSASERARELTAREREVVTLIADGWTSKEIGTQLGIAVPTVDTHRRQIMDKLSIRTIAELTKFAIREGLTTADE